MLHDLKEVIHKVIHRLLIPQLASDVFLLPARIS
jgi:hypothetical protein